MRALVLLILAGVAAAACGPLPSNIHLASTPDLLNGAIDGLVQAKSKIGRAHV